MEKFRRIERLCYSIGSYEETYLKMLILLTIDTSRSDVNIKPRQKSTFKRKWTLNLLLLLMSCFELFATFV